MPGRIVVVGLGPGSPGLLTAETAAAIERIPTRFVRTSRHPSASAVPDGRSFDWAYEQATRLEDVYLSIAAALVEAAEEYGEVLYAVPGSPVVGERTVELLQGDSRVDVEILAAMSFLDLAWARLGVDPMALGVRLIDGHRFATEAAGQRGPLLVAQCDSKAVLSDIKLAVENGSSVTVLQRLGLPDESLVTVAWDELDRVVHPDHLTSLWIPVLASPVAAELVLFDELVHTLRERCPWDREQTHQSLTRHLLEETYEVLEAIDGLGVDFEGAEHLEEELGDLLFQVVFHATLASEEGLFDLSDVARGIRNKLIHRHPHVFGDVEARTAGQVMHNWEQIKQAEKGRESVMDGIPGHLPSLLYAHKAQRKAASVGFDWTGVEGAWPKIAEETAELEAAVAASAGVIAGGEAGEPGEAVEEELGDLLFAVVNVARHLDIDPEAALRAATAKFRDRFMAVERLAASRSVELRALDLAGLDVLWDEVKASGRTPS
ncbi:MAG: tetrapyrrole methylase family protein / MazG family protein [Acidimicrobiaceae bacterium]|nr:tetrapyrrole methylase family protein / MazG family protein [Acidimicrobiaceae bacterium]